MPSEPHWISGLTDLRAFLHRMGRETRQGEVGIVIDGQYFGINRYDDS
jgi:hypothetical protein